jgi:hypothetical protein
LSVDLFVEDENDQGTPQRHDFDGKESLIDKSSTGGLDQTIVIGEMEEGNIFDDLECSPAGRRSSIIKKEEMDSAVDEIKMTRGELQDLVDHIRLKHRAELDAIMVEQGVYKRIIKQMISKFKS